MTCLRLNMSRQLPGQRRSRAFCRIRNLLQRSNGRRVDWATGKQAFGISLNITVRMLLKSCTGNAGS